MRKIIAIILSMLLVIGAVFMVGCADNGGTPSGGVSGGSSGGSSGSSSGGQVSYTTPRSVRVAMSGATNYMEEEGNNVDYVEKRIEATVKPATAKQEVDFTVAWAKEDAELVSDYVVVVPDADGSTKAGVRCYKEFGERVIYITVTTRDGGLTDVLKVTYEGLMSTMWFDTSALELDEYIEDCYLLRFDVPSDRWNDTVTDMEYEIPIKIQNLFGDVPERYELKVYDISSNVDVYTRIYIEREYEDGPFKGETHTVPVLLKQNLGDSFGDIYIPEYLKNYPTTGNNKENYENPYLYIDSGFNFLGYLALKYFLHDEMGVNAGDLKEDETLEIVNYDDVHNSYTTIGTTTLYEVSDLNEQAVEDAYIDITVKDEISGQSATIRVCFRDFVSSVDIGADIVF